MCREALRRWGDSGKDEVASENVIEEEGEAEV